MEGKAKSAAPAPKGQSKAEKKEPPAAPPRRADPAPATPEPEIPPPQDGAAEDDAGVGSSDSLEHLKPFLIAGAVIAAGAILLGALLLARRN